MEKSLRRRLIHLRQALVRGAERRLPQVAIEDAAETLLASRQLWAAPEFDNDVPPCLRREYDWWLGETDEAWVRRFSGDVGIDPWSGHIFLGRRVVWGSTDMATDRARERSPKFLWHGLNRGRRYRAVVSLHHKFDTNFFHFVNNVLVKLGMLKRAGLDNDLPVVVSARLGATGFFRDAVRLGLFGDREVIVQGPREVIRASTVYTVKAHDPDKAALDDLLDRCGVADRPAGNARVLVKRGRLSPNQRLFRNQAALEEMLREFGVETIDPMELSFGEQIARFSAASLVIGAHGAGLTNILWRRNAPGTLIELFNPNLASPHYFLYARYYGHDYHCLTNLNAVGKASFASSEVDLAALRAVLEAL